MSEHQVTIARTRFDFTPDPYPSWLPPGERASAKRGDTITIGKDDYQRGLRCRAFTGPDPRTLHLVKVTHALFDYTPPDYPIFWPEGKTAMAVRGDEIVIDDEDFRRGDAHAAFTPVDVDRYGVAGEPPLAGQAFVFANWVRGLTPAQLQLFVTDLTTAAGDDQDRQKLLAEIGALLAVRDTSGRHMMFNLERVHELARRLTGLDQAERDAQTRQLLSTLVTNPDAFRALLDD